MIRFTIATICLSAALAREAASQTPVPITLGSGYQTVDIGVGGGACAIALIGPSGTGITVLEQLAAYPASTWTSVGYLDAAGYTGPAVVSTDGVRFAVGRTGNLQNGRVWVYRRTGPGSWILEGASLVGGSPSFGTECVIRGVQLAASSGPGGTTNMYSFNAGAWVQDVGGVRGGHLSLDPNRLAVGDPTMNGTGRVWVYEQQGSSWGETAAITSSDLVAGDQFGASVALDGDILVVGNPSSDVAVGDGGAVYIYRFVGGAWYPEARLLPSDVTYQKEFGREVAIKGGRVIVGTGPSSPLGSGQGIYVFDQTGQYPFITWTQVKKLTSTLAPGMGRHFSYDGHSLIAGTSYTSGPHALAYQLPVDPTIYCTSKVTSEGCTPSISSSGSISLTGLDNLVISATSVTASVPGMFIWGRSAAAIPFNGSTLCIGIPIIRTIPQYASGPVGVPCAGSYSYNLTHAEMTIGGVGPGDSVFAQYYLRDNGFTPPNNIALSNAVHIVMRP